ncbi:prolipoprotein diacylglyceryl transferase [Mycobacterium sp. 3519A]|uniref:prolipoprotein diacylglyceryl transferase n=1 Tax=Mycobacterium sp. 3519A TaxID=2057184 RepID=UPI000C79C470|nr:prolipoprotein diacylglyceryl transferase [Mycobacterium sp. 3519A]
MTTTYLAYIPSPSQGVWHIGPVPLRAYALFIIVGIIAALVLGDRRWVARGGQQGVIYDIALWAVPFGLIGGRLYHVMTDWRTYFGEDGAGVAGALRIWDGGLGIWGAVALGAVGAWIGCRQKGIPLSAFGDAIAPGIILAQAIGRLGNYFNQELYGRPTTLPWGLEIYERRDASGALDTLNGVSTGQLIEVVHPTFLYELLWNLLVFAALLWIDKRFKIGHGRLFAMYVAGYCVGRFWVELMRSDVATHIAGIRINSFTSTFVFVGAVVYIMVAPKGREDPASLVGKPEDDHAVLAKELTTVAATTGVVAAAKAAGDVEAEDAKAVAEPETEDAEALGADVAGVPADSVEDAEKFAAEGEEEPEAGLGAVEGEEVADAVEAAPEVHEAEVEAAEEAEAVADEAAAKAKDEEAEAPSDDAEVEAADEAEAVADEPATEAEAEPEAVEADAEAEPDDEAEAVAVEAAAEAEAEPEEVEAVTEVAAADEPATGLGAVEGAEVADAVEAAPEVHDAEAEAADQAETVADEEAEEAAEGEEPEEVTAEVAADDEPLSEAAAEAEELAEEVVEAPDEEIEAAAEFAAAFSEADAVESDDSEPDEPETEAAEAAVEEAETEPSEEEEEAVVDEAASAADDEPKTGVLEQAEPEPPKQPEPAGRLSRLFRRNR